MGGWEYFLVANICSYISLYIEHVRDKEIEQLHDREVPFRRDQIRKTLSIPNDTLGFFNIVGLILITIWGLIILTWYWVLLVSIGTPFLIPIFYGLMKLDYVSMSKYQHLFSLICIGISVFVWIGWAINHFS